MTDPYDALVLLAEREAELVAARSWQELEDLNATRRAIVASLPAVPPASARTSLERAAALQAATSAALREARSAVGAELGRIERGRMTMRGYAPVAHEPRLADLTG